MNAKHTNVPYKGVFISVAGARGLESLSEDAEFSGEAA